jgi:hypothetical protein
MGEVYRARDINLKRNVAIKVLPSAVALDADRLARFRREAELLAGLNHPNIAHVFGLEQSADAPALVMELVEGPTLADRLARGSVPLPDALAIARQIAEALEAAHEQGIVHRDVKPANVKVRVDGTVKVLDFGLARAFDPVDDDIASSPTTSMRGTMPGTILGTAAYMSPEQARGEPATRQADIWSFGVVLYELLTGVSPFARPTIPDTLAGVVGREPDYSVLPAHTPAIARLLVRRCLEKDPKRRLRNMGDVRIGVEEALATVTSESDPAGAATSRLKRRRWLLPAASLIALGVYAGWWGGRRTGLPVGSSVIRLSIASMEAPFAQPYGTRYVAISRDGSRIAYTAASRLAIRRMDRADPVNVETVAWDPFFSPSGEWVAFFSVSGDGPGLKKVPAAGGAPVSVVPTPERGAGGTWGPGGTIVFATAVGLYQVPDSGGAPKLLVKPDAQRRERAYAWPRFLPDGRSVLFTILSTDAASAPQIAVLDLETLRTTTILKDGSDACYVQSGHLVYTAR